VGISGATQAKHTRPELRHSDRARLSEHLVIKKEASNG
tara:strand:- start:522 stop:635 length:114 start_codon:yes stop_codon:yes gene_type:complete